MRKLNVLNSNREPVGLDTVIYTNKTIDEVVYIDSDGTEVTMRMIYDESYVFVTDPSTEKQAEWLASYNARSTIVKETYTIREVLALNLLTNGFFDVNSVSETNILNGGTRVVEDGRLKFTTDDNDAYCGFNIIKTMTHLDNYYVSFRGFPAAKNYALQTMYSYDDLITVAADQEEQKFSTLFNNDNASTGGLSFRQYNENTEYSVYFDDIILINTKYFDEFMTKERMDYITTLYVRIKYGKSFNKKVFAPSAKTKFDVAYTNKTIDTVEYIGPSGKQYTLRDIFGDGGVGNHGGKSNLIVNAGFIEDYDENGRADGWGNYSTSATWTLPGDGIQRVEYANSSGVLRGIGILGNSFGANANPLDRIYQSIEERKTANDTNPTNTNVLGVRGYDDLTAKGNLTAASVQMETDFVKREHFVNIPDDETYGTVDIVRLMTYMTVADGYTLSLEFRNAEMYNVTQLFDIGDMPTDEEFVALLALWKARKDLKQYLTYEDIFEKLQVFSTVNGQNFSIDSDGKITIMSEVGETGYVGTGSVVTVGNSYYYSLDIIVFEGSGKFAASGYSYQSLLETGRYSGIFEALATDVLLSRLSSGNYNLLTFSEVYVVSINNFDERITQAQLDTMLATYKANRNVIIEPEVYVVTEPGPGLGGRYKMKSVGDYVIGHEMDFEDISFRLNFGINYPVYDGYNLVREMLKDNKGVIEYDWGKGSRYADVRLLQAPKTEKDSTNLLTNKWSFKMLNPFYKIVSLDPSSPDLITNKNTHELPLKPYIRLNITTTTPMVELENDDTSNIDQEIRFNFTGVTTPFELIIDCENKKITFADGSNAYGYLNMNYNSFFELIYNTPYVLYFNGCTLLEWTHKQWVID